MNTTHPALADGPIYLDYNATTPVDPRVMAVLVPLLEKDFGNPATSHAYGAAARRALDVGRGQVAKFIGADADEIVFCGSGSEANLLAVRGTALAAEATAPHIITQTTEHPSILETCRALHRLHSIDITYLPVDGDGLVDPAALAAALRPETVLVSIMAANNETGALQPIAELAAITRDHGVAFHCDAAQTAAKIPIDVTAWGIDAMTLVGHKMYAPKGIAALYIRRGLNLEPVAYGGGQERGLRAGTDNVALAVAMGAAAEAAGTELTHGAEQRTRNLRDRLHHQLERGLPGRVHLNGPQQTRLPNTLNISIDGTRGHELLNAIPGIAAATGSACHETDYSPSPVLTAMGLPSHRALSALRLTLGRWTTHTDIDTAAAALIETATTKQQP